MKATSKMIPPRSPLRMNSKVDPEILELLKDPNFEALSKPELDDWFINQGRAAVEGYQLREQHLCGYILYDAIKRLLCGYVWEGLRLRLSRRKNKEIIMERSGILAWLKSNDDRTPLSFLFICDYLDVNPSYVRRKVKQFSGETFPETPLSRPKFELSEFSHVPFGPLLEDDSYVDMYKMGSMLHLAGVREKPSSSVWIDVRGEISRYIHPQWLFLEDIPLRNQ